MVLLLNEDTCMDDGGSGEGMGIDGDESEGRSVDVDVDEGKEGMVVGNDGTGIGECEGTDIGTVKGLGVGYELEVNQLAYGK
jgi:hypothetical protein